MAFYNPSRRCDNCDDYFTEDDQLDGRRAETREYAQVSARRQRCMAAKLSAKAASDWLDEIREHAETMESLTMPNAANIDSQTEIKWFMRPYLLDFLVEAHRAFRLLPDTLFLAINITDRYCSERVVYKRHYQLVGSSALLIAAKYGDYKDHVPTVRELKSMCRSEYEEEMFIEMERHILVTLKWLIGHPTVDYFLELFRSEVIFHPEVQHMAMYLCENALYAEQFVSVRPSILAHSALELACRLLRCSLDRDKLSVSYYDPCVEDQLLRHLMFGWAMKGEGGSITTGKPSSVLYGKYQQPKLYGVSARFETIKQSFIRLSSPDDAPSTPPALQNSTSNANVDLTPLTPQKSQYSAVMQHGCLTPPITPDIAIGASHSKQGVSAPMYSTTSTSTSQQALNLQPNTSRLGY